MKRLLIIMLFLSTAIFAQDQVQSFTIPANFDILYLIFFALGMLIHYAYKVYSILGSAKFLSGLTSNLIGWFVNKFHYTILAGAGATIIGLASSYGFNVAFSSINLIGIGVSIVAGYIGDMANSGTIQ